MKNTMIIFAMFCSVGLNASTVTLDTLPDCLRWTGDVDAFETLRIASKLDAANVAYDTIEYQIYRDSLGTVIDTVDVYSLRVINDFGEFIVSTEECVVPSTLGVFPALQATYLAIETDAVIGGGGGGGGGANYSVTEYKTPGTYTYEVPAGCIALRVICVSGGGGGGAGGLRATGVNSSGGAGGWSGSVIDATVLGYEIDSTSYTVTVGAGGAGAPGSPTNDSNGADGSSGGLSSFSNFIQAPGGLGGGGGRNISSSNVLLVGTFDLGGSNGIINAASFSLGNGGGQGRTTSGTSMNGSPSSEFTSISPAVSFRLTSPGGGCGGAGVSNTNAVVSAVNRYGGAVASDTSSVTLAGSTPISGYMTLGGEGGGVQSNGANGTDHVARFWKYTTTAGFGTGGGGGGAAGGATPAGNGGRGGHGGGGGGGGGGARNGGQSGAGGDGGDGVVIVIAFY